MEYFDECVKSIANALVEGREIYVLYRHEPLIEALLESVRDFMFHLSEKKRITWNEYEKALSNLYSGEVFHPSRCKSQPIVFNVELKLNFSEGSVE